MKLSSISDVGLTTLLQLLPSTHASRVTFGEGIRSCDQPNFKGNCKNPYTQRYTCTEIPDWQKATQHGDFKGTSVQINGNLACRFFNLDITGACRGPILDNKGKVMKDGWKGTDWFMSPGLVDWEHDWQLKTVYCVDKDLLDQVPEIVVAV